MLVKLQFHDNESFTISEVIKQAKHNYGNAVSVEVYPESNMPHDILYFALKQMITHEQLSLIYDSKGSYHQDIKKLRAEILYKVEEILNEVILDNEEKVSD